MPSRNFLALDTSSNACSVALCYGGQTTQRFVNLPQQHTQLILPMVESLLGEAGITLSLLDGLAFGVGPGSFTGLRIAASVIQALAIAAKLPVIPISTLQTLAQMAKQTLQVSHVLAVIDARMQEFYWGCYSVDSDGIMQLHGEERLTALADIKVPNLTHLWYGVGMPLPAMTSITPSEMETLPDAATMLCLADYAYQQGQVLWDAATAQPHYLRNQVVYPST